MPSHITADIILELREQMTENLTEGGEESEVLLSVMESISEDYSELEDDFIAEIEHRVFEGLFKTEENSADSKNPDTTILLEEIEELLEEIEEIIEEDEEAHINPQIIKEEEEEDITADSELDSNIDDKDELEEDDDEDDREEAEERETRKQIIIEEERVNLVDSIEDEEEFGENDSLYEICDRNEDGVVTREELFECFSFIVDQIGDSPFAQILDQISLQKEGIYSPEEFAQFERTLDFVFLKTQPSIEDIFGLFDLNGDGLLSHHEFGKLFGSDQVNQIFMMMGKQPTDFINYQEFLDLITESDLVEPMDSD